MSEEEYISGMLTRTRLFMDEIAVGKVKNTVFAIAGMGGVGAITVELLARWGVKKFRLFDMDVYDESNLNRQLFATSETIGRCKVDVAAERIKEINPHAEVEMSVRALANNENAEPFVKGAGIIIQNADRPSAKLFYLYAQKYKIPLINGFATVTGGRVQTFDYRKSSCETVLERLWKKIKYGNQKALTEMSAAEITAFDNAWVHSTSPSLNFVTNTVGCLIVAEAVKLLSGYGKHLSYPQYLAFDTFDFNMKIRNSLSPLNPDNLQRMKDLLKRKII
ncbi:MAG: ThiF family adenylyltransferase [Desulfococcaceae bacterium]|jgi:tRNA A37 threonylcarbamoyladenosine dehydratase|nr:ThiF family adenylyltransferase [Desulfococcaceae bacterium]